MLHRISSTDNWDHEMKIPRALLLHSSIQPLPTRTSFECLTSPQKQRKGNDCSTGFFQQTTDILKWAHLGNCYYTPVCNHYIFWVLTGAQKQRKGHDCSIGFLQQTTEIVTWEHLGHCFYTLVFHDYPLSDECEHRVAMILLMQTCMVCKMILYN